MAIKRPKAGVRTYVITNIKYDTDGIKVKLPKRMEMTIPPDVEGYDAIERYISDAISDRTGYCHAGFATTPEIIE